MRDGTRSSVDVRKIDDWSLVRNFTFGRNYVVETFLNANDAYIFSASNFLLVTDRQFNVLK